MIVFKLENFASASLMKTRVCIPLLSLPHRSHLVSFRHTRRRCSLRAPQEHAGGKSLHVLYMHEAQKMRSERMPIPVDRVKHRRTIHYRSSRNKFERLSKNDDSSFTAASMRTPCRWFAFTVNMQNVMCERDVCLRAGRIENEPHEVKSA